MAGNPQKAVEALDRAFFLDYPLEAARLIDETPEREVLPALGKQTARVLVPLWQRLSPVTAVSLLRRLPDRLAKDLLRELPPSEAVNLISSLEKSEQENQLSALDPEIAEEFRSLLSYPAESAGRLMQRNVVAVSADWTVGRVIDYLRDADGLPADFFDLFLVDDTRKPIGTIPLSRVLRTARDVRLTELKRADMRLIPVDMDQEEVAFVFSQRDLISAPVVDVEGKLLGVITIDDIVDVIHEEHEEDIMGLAGVGGEDFLFHAIIDTTRSRFLWLMVHLVAAIAASVVISQFAGTIEELVALAILMPIVATMGGTAGIQALTVAVQAIAMKELTSANAMRAILPGCWVPGHRVTSISTSAQLKLRGPAHSAVPPSKAAD